MAQLNISGKVVYAAAPLAAEVPAAGVEVTIRDADVLSSHVIFSATTDDAGNFDGQSAEWQNQPLDVMSLQIRVKERQYGTEDTNWMPYAHRDGERMEVVLPWGPPNLKMFGDVLVVAGRNAAGDFIYGGDETLNWTYAERLMLLLYSMPPFKTPVRRGSHDFWMIFPVPAFGGTTHNRPMAPLPQLPGGRAYGGFVHFNRVPQSTSAEELSGFINTSLHELAHKWLVPPDIIFDEDDSTTALLSQEDFVRAVNADTAFGGATMLGRDNSHWSPFWEGDRSVMDAASYEKDVVNGVARWVATRRGGETLTVDELPPFIVEPRFNDLEQVIMGLRRKDEAYTATDGRVRWIEPKLTAPRPYFAGLFAELPNGDLIEFGYLNDHRRICVLRNGSVVGEVESGDELQTTGVKLTLDYTLGQIRCSIRDEGEPAGCLTVLWDWLKIIPFVRERTPRYVAVVDSREPPVRVGAHTRTVRKEEFALETSFLDLTLHDDDGGPIAAAAGDVPQLADLSTLPALEWRRHVPADGPIFRTLMEGREQRILLPRALVNSGGTIDFQTAFDRTTDDRIPRFVIAPPSTFRLTSTVRIHRSTLSPWSGAPAPGTTIWGTEKSAAVANVVFSDAVKQKQQLPPDNTLKAAYIIVARNFSDVSEEMIARVDAVRRAVDPAFAMATEQRAHLDSSLE